MRTLESSPEHFPGVEFSQVKDHSGTNSWIDDGPIEYCYEIYGLRQFHTADGGPQNLPVIEYRTLITGSTLYGADGYEDKASAYIYREHMSGAQQEALQKAIEIEDFGYDTEDPLTSFIGLHAVRADLNGLLYASSVSKGGFMTAGTTLAPVQSLQKLGVIDFATSARSHSSVFQYDSTEVGLFVPESLQGDANAYAQIDHPRIVSEVPSSVDYHTVKMMLLNVQLDLRQPDAVVL